MAVDYLKTYLGIDPDDYSAMEARIRGEEPQAQAPVMMQPRMMPQTRSLGEMEAMPMAPRSQPTPQVDDRYQSLMDEIASLKAQIEGMQAPTEQAPVMADEPVSPSLPQGVDAGGRFFTGPNGENMYQPPMPKIGPGQFQAQVMPPAINLDTGMPLDTSLPILNNRLKTEPYQAPPEIQNRMVGEPQKLPQEPVPFQTQAPSQDIQASIDYLAKLPKMNIPQIPDMEQIRQKMEEANMTFPEPVSYQDQLQAIKDLPPMPPVTPMPQAIKQPSRSGIFGNLLDRVQKQIKVPTPPSMPASPMLQTKPAYMPTRARSMLDTQQKFAPQRFADGGGIDKAIYDLKFKLNG